MCCPYQPKPRTSTYMNSTSRLLPTAGDQPSLTHVRALTAACHGLATSQAQAFRGQQAEPGWMKKWLPARSAGRVHHLHRGAMHATLHQQRKALHGGRGGGGGSILEAAQAVSVAVPPKLFLQAAHSVRHRHRSRCITSSCCAE